MPRKAKEKEIINETENIINDDTKSKKSISKTTKKVTKAKTTAKKDKDTKSSTKTTKAKVETKSSSKTTKPSTTKKTSTPKTKNTEEKKSSAKASTTKKTSKTVARKKVTAKTTKTATKKESSKKNTNTSTKKSKTADIITNIQTLEYYDLPYKYENTTIKLLAQTPKTLFAYWNISDTDINTLKKLFGENFLYNSIPILIVHNLTLNETYEIEINDFANCWYINVSNSDCEFDVELARKFNNDNNYLHITKSNNLQSPNDHILFEKLNSFINFKNIKTGKKIEKNINSYTFLEDLYKFYKNLYKDEFVKNPSSNTFI